MKYECLKLEERRIIEAMYAEGAKPDEIAKRVGKCRATIYRELERGKTGETDSRFRQGYSAAVAEARVNRSYRNRGRRKRHSKKGGYSYREQFSEDNGKPGGAGGVPRLYPGD